MCLGFFENLLGQLHRGDADALPEGPIAAAEAPNAATEAWLRAAADWWGVAPERFDAVTAPGIERATRALARHRELLEGKSIFFFPDSQLEVPIARFLARELGMQLVEVGSP